MSPDGLSPFQIAELWATVALTTLIGLCARLARSLFDVNTDPPVEAELLKHWKRRRAWMIMSEVSAVPAIATGWIAAGLHYNLSYTFVVLGSMTSGALGFGFLLHAVQTFINRKAGEL